MKTAYLDDSRWVELNRGNKSRLPGETAPCTEKEMRRWMRKLRFPMDRFRAWCGFADLVDWMKANPSWSLRAFVGLLLEEVTPGENAD